MPDSEMFKIVMQGGSFALLAMILVGAMRWVPTFIAAIREASAAHVRVADGINAANSINIEKINQAHIATCEIQAAAHKEAVATMVKDCREERRELVQRLIAETKS